MKKISRLIICIGLLFCFAVAAPAAWAEEAVQEVELEGKSWDDLMGDFLEYYHVAEGQVTIGYYNTVTGEEHYYDPDRYMVTGSMYKVPLTMVFADKDAAGELDLETGATGGFKYTTLMKGAIVDSNNDYAAVLWRALGSYHEYRRIIAPYMGEDPDNVDAKYYENNFFTARQMLTCLKKLYEGSETYSYIIELMKAAEQSEYFCRHEDRYEVAHKYGYLADDSKGVLYLNDCGIVYTEEPYLLVCFTAGAEKPYGILSNLCTLMSDYTQYQYEQRKEQEAAAEAERMRQEAQEALERAREEGRVPEASAAPGAASPQEAEEEAPGTVSRAVVLAVLFLLCGGLIVLAEVKSGSFTWKRLLLALLCALLSLLFWVSSVSSGV